MHTHPTKQTTDNVYYLYRMNAPLPTQTKPPYELDYLVPLILGGSTAQNNLWPAATTGIGLTQKQQLADRLRNLICRGQLQLADIQHQIVADWYALWVTYIYNTGN